MVAALLVFLVALALSSSPSYGASPKPPKKAAKKPKPKVKASVHRGQLNVLGTARGDRITLRLKRGNTSRLQVDVGGNGSAEFTFKRSRFNRIIVHAGSGGDTLSVDESYGVFVNREATTLFGDGGSDVVVGNGSNAAERFEFSRVGSQLRYRRNGNAFRARVDRFDLRPRGGADRVVVNDLAGAGLGQLNADLGNDNAADAIDVKGSSAANELRVGGAINVRGIGAVLNIARAQAANDKLNLDPAVGTDRVVVEGTAGNDTIGVAPAAVAPHIAVSGGPGGLPIDVVNAEALAVEALAGNDTLNGAIGLAALTQLTLDGGAGNDTINGGDGNDSLRGGSENDAVDGNRGDDTGLLGAGDDSFTWDPGDGSDKVEGEAGTDTMIFNGAGVAESFDFSANGNRLKFFRNVANITMDVDDTERVDLRALGGIDNTVVNDLSATDVKNIELDLETAIGGGAGDGAVDTTTVNGTAGNDTIKIAPNAGAVDVTGLAAAREDRALGGRERRPERERARRQRHDLRLGRARSPDQARDRRRRRERHDQRRRRSRDAARRRRRRRDRRQPRRRHRSPRSRQRHVPLGSRRRQRRRRGPRRADDGADTLLFNGAGVAENFDVSANGERVRFFRDVANITMDLNDIELIDVQALGGADSAVLNDISGTDLKSVALDLEAAIGGGVGDGAADSVTVNGTNDADDIQISADGSAVDVFGAQANLRIDHSEAANDKLTVNGLGGADTITAGAWPRGTDPARHQRRDRHRRPHRRRRQRPDRRPAAERLHVRRRRQRHPRLEPRRRQRPRRGPGRATTRWSSTAPPATRTSAIPRTTGG